MPTIQTEMNEKVQKAYTRKASWILLVMMIIGIAGLLAYIFIDSIEASEYGDMLLMIASVFFGVGLVFYISINMRVKKMSAQKYVNQYEFADDEIIITTIQNGSVFSTHNLKYNEIRNVTETKEYIYIIFSAVGMTKMAYIIEKTMGTTETVESIRNILQSKVAPGKYKQKK